MRPIIIEPADRALADYPRDRSSRRTASNRASTPSQRSPKLPAETLSLHSQIYRQGDTWNLSNLAIAFESI
ncbi:MULTISPECIES: hypothetical protein [unclassified Microcoleus]|uniref:hypothetical protein n=1 Tax=unclassified Microcoleus TaxID=2642155 RepID=UPI002FCEB1CC